MLEDRYREDVSDLESLRNADMSTDDGQDYPTSVRTIKSVEETKWDPKGVTFIIEKGNVEFTIPNERLKKISDFEAPSVIITLRNPKPIREIVDENHEKKERQLQDAMTPDLIVNVHQVWIGPGLPEEKGCFVFNKNSFEGMSTENIRMHYWIDDTKISPEEQEKIHLSYRRGRIQVRSIRDLACFQYIDTEAIYERLFREKKFNYIKELVSLMIIYEHGGYFVDTTTHITSEVARSSLRNYNKFIVMHNTYANKEYTRYLGRRRRPLLFQRRSWNVSFDLWFYYSPQGFWLTRLLLVNLVNSFKLYYELGFKSYSGISKWKEFQKAIPKLVQYFPNRVLDSIPSSDFDMGIGDLRALNMEMMKLTYLPIISFCGEKTLFSFRHIVLILSHLDCFLVSLIKYINYATEECFIWLDRVYMGLFSAVGSIFDPATTYIRLLGGVKVNKETGMSGWKEMSEHGIGKMHSYKRIDEERLRRLGYYKIPTREETEMREFIFS